MKKKTLLDRLLGQTGQVIKRADVEMWTSTESSKKYLISMGISMINGTHIVIACAGDGHLSFRPRRSGDFTKGDKLKTLSTMEGDALDSVFINEHGILLSTRSHRIEISNCDDELVVKINGTDVRDIVAHDSNCSSTGMTE